MKITKTAFYFSVSVVIVLSGLVLLLAFKQYLTLVSISTSIIAAGMTSIFFGFNHYLNEREEDDASYALKKQVEELSDDIDNLNQTLEDVRSLVRVVNDSNKSRIFDRHPDDEFLEELKQIHRRRTIRVDSLGLTLKQFCDDNLKRFIDRGNSVVRLLIQNPLQATFSMICHQEGREERGMADEVLFVTRQILSLNAQRPGGGTQTNVYRSPSHNTQNNSDPTIVEVKWFDSVPSITFTKLNHVMFVRSRYLNEANEAPTFFERYYDIEGIPFAAFSHYFELAWNAATIPTDEMCAQLEDKFKVKT